jgi:hypothetical protein
MGMDFGGYGMINMNNWELVSYCHAAQMSKSKEAMNLPALLWGVVMFASLL